MSEALDRIPAVTQYHYLHIVYECILSNLGLEWALKHNLSMAKSKQNTTFRRTWLKCPSGIASEPLTSGLHRGALNVWRSGVR